MQRRSRACARRPGSSFWKCNRGPRTRRRARASSQRRRPGRLTPQANARYRRGGGRVRAFAGDLRVSRWPALPRSLEKGKRPLSTPERGMIHPSSRHSTFGKADQKRTHRKRYHSGSPRPNVQLRSAPLRPSIRLIFDERAASCALRVRTTRSIGADELGGIRRGHCGGRSQSSHHARGTPACGDGEAVRRLWSAEGVPADCAGDTRSLHAAVSAPREC
jgi:hypothetical protein